MGYGKEQMEKTAWFDCFIVGCVWSSGLWEERGWIRWGSKGRNIEKYGTDQKSFFSGTFGQYFEVGVIATEEEILYTCSKQDVLGKTEPEVISKSFGCGHDTWWDLVSIYSDNLVFDWKEQEYYVNKCYSQEPGQFEEYPEVEFLEEGGLFLT